MDSLYGFVILSVLGLIAANLAIHRLYFVVWPQRAIRKYRKADPERLRRYLERVAATPSLIGPAQKLTVRHQLMQLHWPEGRHAEAVEQAQAILAALAVNRKATGITSLESSVRHRLADCLEALGRLEESATQRELAQQSLDHAAEDSLRHLTQGKLHERANRHEDSIESFERALELIKESDRAGRVECMTRLVLACFNAGRPADCLRWAEAVLELDPKPVYLRTALRMAGIACGHLGRLDDSEAYCRRAYDAVIAEGNPTEIGRVLAGLADIQRRRGKLVEAHETCLKAAEIDPKAVRAALASRVPILRHWGRFDEALALLDQHDATGPFETPFAERRMQAASALTRSKLEVEAGRPDDAWVHIQQAVAELGNDPKLGLVCDAVASWVFAARGLADDSRRVADLAEGRLDDFQADPSTIRVVLFDLGMAAWTRGDHDEGVGYWDRYLEQRPDPIYQPTAYFFRGECRRALGDEVGARADFRAALAVGIDCHDARRARSRLAEIPP